MKNQSTALAIFAITVIAVGFCRAAEVNATAEPMSVWCTSPARSFHESCPLGNGRLGAMDCGGVGKERIVLNESSLWSGGPYDGNRYDACKCLPEVREKLFSGDISAAWATLGKGFRYADEVRGWLEPVAGCLRVALEETIRGKTSHAAASRPRISGLA